MKRFRHLLSIVFIVATLLGSMHHHDDFKVHNDCQICTLQHNLSNGDIPTQALYLQEIENLSSPIFANLSSLHVSTLQTNLNARAPPFYS